jgi:hypothetical protein
VPSLSPPPPEDGPLGRRGGRRAGALVGWVGEGEIQAVFSLNKIYVLKKVYIKCIVYLS